MSFRTFCILLAASTLAARSAGSENAPPTLTALEQQEKEMFNLGRGFDIIWDANGAGNYFDKEVTPSFPPVPPKTSRPRPLYNLYWRLANFMVGLAG
jgi:hypothetical protein